MPIFPIICPQCNKISDVYNSKICPYCNSQGELYFAGLKVHTKLTKPFVFDCFSDGKGSVDNPMLVTDIKQLKEEYRKRPNLDYIS
ncbi:MAG: hypothetical protein KJ769_08400 [Candidatus Margulisbacteria bacterium]|nr:hypothetical protein [Candidatus Margulisiibacteriota bacterium]